MRILGAGLPSSVEGGTGICARSAATAEPLSSRALAALPIILLALLLAGCRADGGVPGNPIGIKLQWFSFLDGDDFKDRCHEGDPDRYRFIYNARFEEQVRVYDVTRYGEEAIFVARAVAPGFVLTSTDHGLDFGWQESKDRLSPQELAELRGRLQESGFFEPTPVGLELFSPDFYWVGMSCEEGRFHYTAFARPSPQFDALTFPGFLFERDKTGLAVNPPRNIPFSERLRAMGGGQGPVEDREPAFRMVVDEEGVAGNYALF
jgi:hypothetical protein